MKPTYMNLRPEQDRWAERDRILAEGEVAHSIGGRTARWVPDDTPHAVVFVLSDGNASRGGLFAFELDEAEKLYQQLHKLLDKPDWEDSYDV